MSAKNIKIYESKFLAILSTVATGETIFYAMTKHKVDDNFLAWVMQDEERKSVYEEAQKVAAEVLAHKMLQLTEATPEPEDQYMIGVRQKVYEKLMEKWNADRYGPKKQIEQTVTVDISGAMEKASLRLTKGVTLDGEID